MTQPKLYPSGELKAHPPLRTLDEAMRERIARLLNDVLNHGICAHCEPEMRAVLALLKE